MGKYYETSDLTPGCVVQIVFANLLWDIS